MSKSIVLVADAYPPSRTSAALQLRDLAHEFAKQGFLITVITPDSDLRSSSSLGELEGVRILRLKTPEYKNTSNIRRAVAEMLMPFLMIWRYRKCALKAVQWDAVIWYSPTIFLGPFIYYLKHCSACPSYLILRDIFPAWALDLGLIRKGFVYYFFRQFEKFQYSVADYIGVQAAGNLPYFNTLPNINQKKIEVLQNWLSPIPPSRCSISIARLSISNRKIFVYAGNMGIAQGMMDLLLLAQGLIARKDIGFLFIGRGSDMTTIKEESEIRGLENVVFCDEIDAAQIPGLYAQCHVGLIALDARHKTHNIPGKFLSYLQSGLPVMAIVNEGNDLKLMIQKHQVGRVAIDRDPEILNALAISLVEEISSNGPALSLRCKNLAAELFSSKAAVDQISHSLNLVK